MIGDPWSMLIVRDIVYFGKRTFGEFLASQERIATSALSRRLIDLEYKGILDKTTSLEDKRKETYTLTNKGLDLIPTMLELAAWGARYDANTGASSAWITAVEQDKPAMIDRIRQAVRTGNAVFSEGKEATWSL